MNQTKCLTFMAITATAALLASGCSSTVVRENIISAVNTGVGLQIAENPNTQLYEVKLGWVRNQFYSIPTSKVVRKGGSVASATNHIGTPQVVSGFGGSANINGKSLGGGIAESFAVGDTAVNSMAAMMMYMATARTPEDAKAMSEAIRAMHLQTEVNTTTPVTTVTNLGPAPVQTTALFTTNTASFKH